ncbi:MAG: RNA recognition motif domain-containing protein [Candidatus Dependentiae bacterium]
MIIYVGNIASSVSDKNLKKLFEQYGLVTKINFVTDPHTGKFKGFAFIEMPANDEGHVAIEALNGVDLEGSILVVSQASSKQ